MKTLYSHHQQSPGPAPAQSVLLLLKIKGGETRGSGGGGGGGRRQQGAHSGTCLASYLGNKQSLSTSYQPGTVAKGHKAQSGKQGVPFQSAEFSRQDKTN